MGSQFNSITITAKDKAEAVAKAEAHQEQCQHEYGHGAYTGHLGTMAGVDVSRTEYDSVEAANEDIDEIHDKWSPPILARIKGTDQWVFAGRCPC